MNVFAIDKKSGLLFDLKWCSKPLLFGSNWWPEIGIFWGESRILDKLWVLFSNSSGDIFVLEVRFLLFLRFYFFFLIFSLVRGGGITLFKDFFYLRQSLFGLCGGSEKSRLVRVIFFLFRGGGITLFKDFFIQGNLFLELVVALKRAVWFWFVNSEEVSDLLLRQLAVLLLWQVLNHVWHHVVDLGQLFSFPPEKRAVDW